VGGVFLGASIQISANTQRITTHIVVKTATALLPAAEAALRRDWGNLPQLEGAAMHRGVGADLLLEHAHWRSSKGETIISRINARKERVLAAAPSSRIDIYLMTLESIRLATIHGESDFVIRVNPDVPTPILIAVFEVAIGQRAKLLNYLHQASARFVNELEGWTGAALYCAEDGRHVVEYLQFESMDAVAATQGSPTIQAHQAKLQTFGPFKTNLYLVDSAYRRQE